MTRVALAVLLLASACSATPNAHAPDAPDDLRPNADFPLSDVEGCYRCDVISLYFPTEENAEPREEEWLRRLGRGGAALSIGGSALIRLSGGSYAPRAIVTTIEGCPFVIRRTRRLNPQSWDLSSNRCGENRYRDGFLILRSETIEGEHIFRTMPSGEAVNAEPGQGDHWERTEWWITAQLNSDRATHTYDCMKLGCAR